MPSYNQIILLGNLTKDPELRITSGGVAVCSFGLAVNRKYNDSNGEKKEEVTFIDVTCWDNLAKACSQYLHKGSPAFVEGRLRQNSWTTDDGQKRYKHEVVARSVQFLGSGKARDEDEDTAEDDIPF
ncbi:single-stranded DNA-binding protein [Candidatus Poribacteria bacterium]|nr:single-stranded DNA-binding protein [Candidatus Poribacteria bacterium]